MSALNFSASGPHRHSAAHTRQGAPTPLYEFCVCGFVRCVWPNGIVIDWHKPTVEKAAEARSIDMDQRSKAPFVSTPDFDHSPGPWFIDVDRIVDRDGVLVAAVADNGVVWGCTLEDPKSIANAHVIVASPELRAALQEAYELMPLGTAKRAAWMERARRALSRARVGG